MAKKEKTSGAKPPTTPASTAPATEPSGLEGVEIDLGDTCEGESPASPPSSTEALETEPAKLGLFKRLSHWLGTPFRAMDRWANDVLSSFRIFCERGRVFVHAHIKAFLVLDAVFWAIAATAASLYFGSHYMAAKGQANAEAKATEKVTAKLAQAMTNATDFENQLTAKTNELTAANEQISKLEGQLKNAQKNAEEFNNAQAENLNLQKRLDEAQAAITAANETRSGLELKVSQLEFRLATAGKEPAQIQKVVDGLEEKVEQLEASETTAKADVEKAKADLAKAEAKFTELEKQLAEAKVTPAPVPPPATIRLDMTPVEPVGTNPPAWFRMK